MHFSLTQLLETFSEDMLDRTRAYYDTKQPGAGPTSLDALREVRASRQAHKRDARAVTDTAEYDGRTVPVRIFSPDVPLLGVVLDIPGGGFYLSSDGRHDSSNWELAGTTGVAVVSVDYRLAPESPWPAAPEDCETAALWLIDSAAERFGTDRLVVGGTSAGATLALTTLLRLRDRGLVDEFAGAVLRFGTYDLSGSTPAGRRIADEYFLSAYLADAEDRTLPDISPVFADLTGLPPTLLVVGADDVLLEDNLAMAARLSAAHNDVDLRIYPLAPHGFTSHPTPVAYQAREDVAQWITAAVAEPAGEPWDDESFTEVRAAAHTDPARLVELLSDRSVHDIAQLIGDAVLRALDANVPAAHELATRLVKTLNARRWAGDDELSAELNSALGVGPTPTLRSARVDLEELSATLEDGRGEGGRLNVTNGELWQGDPSYYSEDELPDFESDDWLFVGSLGSRESYRDMEIFISSLTDADLAAQLDRAITGRGAFRRFKDVLFDRPNERFAYYLLTDERKRGRAREWLAFAGCRVANEEPFG